jgi:hypothetical protein
MGEAEERGSDRRWAHWWSWSGHSWCTERMQKWKKEKIKFERMLEDHKKLLYPTCDVGQKKLGTTLELLQ